MITHIITWFQDLQSEYDQQIRAGNQYTIKGKINLKNLFE
jgi:hypothetical protein